MLQPVGMIPADRIRVGGKPASFAVNLPGICKIGFEALGIFVGVNKLLPGVIGRIDIDHFDFSEI